MVLRHCGRAHILAWRQPRGTPTRAHASLSCPLGYQAGGQMLILAHQAVFETWSIFKPFLFLTHAHAALTAAPPFWRRAQVNI